MLALEKTRPATLLTRARIMICVVHLTVSGCQSSLSEQFTPGTHDRAKLEAWETKLSEWSKRISQPGREQTPPPRVARDDVGVLIALFPEFGTSPGRVLLAGEADVREEALSALLRYFPLSLGTRIPAWEQIAGRHSSPLRYAMEERDAYVRFFMRMGPAAYAAAGDLMTLLVLKVEHDEYGGGRGLPGEALAAVCSGRPEILIENLQHESASVRRALCEVLRLFRADAQLVGPALAGMVDDESPRVVEEAASALCEIHWSNAALVEALRARILTMDGESHNGARMSGAMGALERQAKEAEQTEPSSK